MHANYLMKYSPALFRKLLLSCLFALVLAGCSGTGEKQSSSRYSMTHDAAPDRAVDLSHVRDAVPRHEPKSRGGNKSPYEVWGKHYYVLANSDGYRQQGTASWYGKKFHGHRTSNGETYDMYGMSAAHKSLPLPTYVRVTNLDNGRQVVVRVNDRGPFHGNRLIDLSYAAAYKLDMLSKGTARVEVEALTPGSATQLATESASTDGVPQPQVRATQLSATEISASKSLTAVARSGVASGIPSGIPSGKYLQVGAYSSWTSAQSVKAQLEALFRNLQVVISKRQGTSVIYRVQIGPVDHLGTLNGVNSTLADAGYADTHLVDLP